MDLEGYLLENSPFAYAFSPNTTLAPGEILFVFVNGSSRLDTHNVRHWGRHRSILNDRGDKVTLRNFANTVLACRAWGSFHC